jgi:hypothetical protein
VGEVYETGVHITGLEEERAAVRRRCIEAGDSMAMGLEFRERGEVGVK